MGNFFSYVLCLVVGIDEPYRVQKKKHLDFIIYGLRTRMQIIVFFSSKNHVIRGSKLLTIGIRDSVHGAEVSSRISMSYLALAVSSASTDEWRSMRQTHQETSHIWITEVIEQISLLCSHF